MPRVKYFCCGYSLKTGTLLTIPLTLIVPVICIALRIYSRDTYQGDEKSQKKEMWESDVFNAVFHVLASVLGFFGAYKGKLYAFQWHLAWELLDILIQIVWMIILPFFIGKTSPAFPRLLNSNYHILAEEIREMIKREYVDLRILTLEDVVFEEIFHSITCVLRLYFWAVALSYHSRLEEELQNERGESA